MPWVKLDAGFPDHPKVVAAGWKAAWLYVCGLTYCTRFLTDGAIPKAQVKRLTDIPKADVEAQRLVDAGLWIEDGDDYRVHDYTEWQTPADKVDELRERGKARAKASYEARAKKTRSNANSSREEPAKKAKSSPEESSLEGRRKKEEVSSSSESDSQPPAGQVAEEEEEELAKPTAEQLAELERRWRARNKPGLEPVTNPFAWRLKTLNDILANYATQPTATTPPHPADAVHRPDCATCDGLSLIESDDGRYTPCPNCTEPRSA